MDRKPGAIDIETNRGNNADGPKWCLVKIVDDPETAVDWVRSEGNPEESYRIMEVHDLIYKRPDGSMCGLYGEVT